jgi:hypothetical protein
VSDRGGPAVGEVAPGVLVVCPTAPGRFDGVADYACWLAAHLAAHTPTALVGLSEEEGPSGGPLPCRAGVPRFTVRRWRELWQRRREPAFDAGAVLFQYVPHLYSKAFDAFWALFWLAQQRVRRRPVVMTVHEYAIPADSLKRAVARVVMNGVVVALGVVASHLVVTFELPRRRIGRLLVWKAGRIAVIPVGSNIVPSAEQPSPIGGHRALCAVFGQPEAMSARLVAALGRWLGEAGGGVRVRWMTRSGAAVRHFVEEQCGSWPSGLEVLERAPADEISRVLASATVFLAPIVDGVSTRRTTVMAALAHGLPIVGTDGPCTDEVLRTSEAFALSPPEDGQAWIAQLERVLGDAALRARMGRAARALYESRFTWDRIAAAYLALLKADARERGS